MPYAFPLAPFCQLETDYTGTGGPDAKHYLSSLELGYTNDVIR